MIGRREAVQRVFLAVERLENLQQARNPHDTMTARRETQQLHVPTLPPHTDILRRDHADAKAVDVGDAAKIEQESEMGFVDEVVHARAEFGRTITKDDVARHLEDRYVSDPAFGNLRRHGTITKRRPRAAGEAGEIIPLTATLAV